MQINEVKQFIKGVPWFGPTLVRLFGNSEIFTTSGDYWDRRYVRGGTSGAGSYNRLAEFKARVVNDFVAEHRIGSVIEYGSGDGAQLRLANYPHYVGVDVSRKSIEMCRTLFSSDDSKQFFVLADCPASLTAELVLSLDVIYHLIEDDVFEQYMEGLFAASQRFVIIYASDMDKEWPAKHVRHRQFTRWVESNCPDWRLRAKVPNAYPYNPADPDNTSFSDFHFYERHRRSVDDGDAPMRNGALS